jgi:uncharacterized protein (TIRG00374 family)
VRRLGLSTLVAWVGLAVSGFFAYVAIRHVDVEAFSRVLADGSYWPLLPATAALGLAIYLRALRWHVLFVREPRPRVNAVLSALLIGYLFNSILPARAGEAIRVVALNQRTGTSRSEALATVVAERVLDVLVLLALLLVSAPLVPEADWLRGASALGGAAFLAIAFVLITLAFHGVRALRYAMRPLSMLPGVTSVRLEGTAENIVEGLAVFRLPRVALRAAALTAASWVVIAFSFWLCLKVVRLDTSVDAALLTVIAVNLAMILPSGPAGLGVFEAAVVLALAPYGVERSEALSYAVVAHVLSVVPLIAVGYVALHRHMVAIRRARRTDTPLPASASV